MIYKAYKGFLLEAGFEFSTQYNSLHGLTITDTVHGLMNTTTTNDNQKNEKTVGQAWIILLFILTEWGWSGPVHCLIFLLVHEWEFASRKTSLANHGAHNFPTLKLVALLERSLDPFCAIFAPQRMLAVASHYMSIN